MCNVDISIRDYWLYSLFYYIAPPVQLQIATNIATRYITPAYRYTEYQSYVRHVHTSVHIGIPFRTIIITIAAVEMS